MFFFVYLGFYCFLMLLLVIVLRGRLCICGVVICSVLFLIVVKKILCIMGIIRLFRVIN